MIGPVSHFIMRFLVIASLIAITYSAELKSITTVKSRVLMRVTNSKIKILPKDQSTYISIKNPLHKPSEKDRVWF